MNFQNPQKSILIVEDEAILALSKSKVLQKYGYKVAYVLSGEDAIEFFKTENDVNLILMDIDLGAGIDGTETAQMILLKYDIPIVFHSSHSEPEIVSKTEKITSYGYVVKDSSITVLDAAIKMAFRLFDAKQELKNTNSKLVATLNVSPVPLAINDDNGNITYLNQAFLQTFGYSLVDIPVLEKWWSLAYPDIKYREWVINSWVERLEEAKKSGKDFEPLEINVRSKDGSIKTVIANAAALEEKFSGIHLVSLFDITDRKEIEDKAKELLLEKDLVLKEVHHRIKNNMNSIYSLLSIEANAVKDKVAFKILEDAANRILSMGVLYDKLYKSQDFTELSLSLYLSSLLDEIIENYASGIPLKIEKDILDIELNVKFLQPLGIILNELVTNILKHAFIDRQSGKIILRAYQKDRILVIQLVDDADRIPKKKQFQNSSAFGTTLINLLTKQLNGNVIYESTSGTTTTLEFPI